MPYIGLIITSIGFFLPAWIAKQRSQKRNTIIISSLATSSIFYHGTLHPYAHAIDVIVAHSVAINYLFLGVKNIARYKRGHDMIGLLLGMLSTHMYYNKSLPTRNEKISRKWHMKVHIAAQLGLIAFVMGASRQKPKNFEIIWNRKKKAENRISTH